MGQGASEGFTVNIPFMGGCGDSSFMEANRRIIRPIVEQFKPDMVIIDIGVDAHYMDPLASLTLSSTGYLELCRRIMNIPSRYGNLLVLEGGYHLEATGEVMAGLAAMCRGVPAIIKYFDNLDPDCAGAEIIEDVVNVQKEYWTLE